MERYNPCSQILKSIKRWQPAVGLLDVGKICVLLGFHSVYLYFSSEKSSYGSGKNFPICPINRLIFIVLNVGVALILIFSVNCTNETLFLILFVRTNLAEWGNYVRVSKHPHI